MSGRGGPDEALDRPGRPPSPLSRRERERILRAGSGVGDTPPDRRPILLAVAGVVVLAIGALFGLAALSGAGDVTAGNGVQAPDDATPAGADSEGEEDAAIDAGEEDGDDDDSSASGASSTTQPPPPPSSRPTTTVATTAPPALLGNALQATLQDGVVSVTGDVPDAEGVLAVVAVLEAVAGAGNVDSALVIDPDVATPGGVSVVVDDSVSFAIGSSAIEAGFLPVLDRMAALMIEDPNLSIVVKGHTDGTGDPVRNLALSQERADAVVDYIADQGVNRFRLEPRGRGSTEPVADDATAEGQAQNRRIEFVLLGLPLGPGA